MKPFLPILTLCLSLAACSSQNAPSNHPADQYKPTPSNSKNSLEVPPLLTPLTSMPRFAIPESAIKAIEAQAVVTNDQTELKQDASGAYLIIKGKTSADIWPHLAPFWQSYGFDLATAEPAAYLMQTGWADRKATASNSSTSKLMQSIGLSNLVSSGNKDRFQSQLVTENGNTKVYFFHEGVAERITGNKNTHNISFDPAAREPAIESAFLSRFQAYLGTKPK